MFTLNPDTTPPTSSLIGVAVDNGNSFEFIGETEDNVFRQAPYGSGLDVQVAIREDGTNNWFNWSTGELSNGTFEFTFLSFNDGNGVGSKWLWSASPAHSVPSGTATTIYYRAIDSSVNFEVPWKTASIVPAGDGIGGVGGDDPAQAGELTQLSLEGASAHLNPVF